MPVPIPGDATGITTSGPRPFVTALTYTLPDGSQVRWQARRNRKEQPVRHGLTWWIGVLFAVGSTCFVIGPVPLYAGAVGGTGDAVTFFVGSLFFTTAAYLLYLQVARDVGHRWVVWAPRHPGFWATLIQLVGTVYFNVTTFAAFLDVPPDLTNRVSWRADAIGSICFLYLWQTPVVVFARAFCGSSLLALVVALPVCYGVAALSWYRIERPILESRFTSWHGSARSAPSNGVSTPGRRCATLPSPGDTVGARRLPE